MAWTMDCCLSAEAAEGRRRHRQIEKQLRLDRRRLRPDVNSLLLGLAGCGKKTFLKQMRIIHGGGYIDVDRRRYTQLMFQNIVTAIQELIYAMKKLRIDYMDEKNISLAEKLSQVEAYQLSTLETWQADAIRQVWNDQGVQRCYDRRREFQLSDSAKYYLSDLDRITDPSYIPTLQDILRVKGTIHDTIYAFKVEYTNFRMVTIDGNRQLRRLMQYCDINCIIFLAALSDYDQVLYESENRLEESLALFKTILHSMWFKETSTILFLNKTDLLEEKIAHSHLATFFPAFTGPQSDAASAREFICQTYLDHHKGVHRLLYAHFICAIDTVNIRHAFKDFKSRILNESLCKFRVE